MRSKTGSEQTVPFVQLIPTNRGGAGKRQPPGARFGKDGQLTINHNAAELLGEPEMLLLYAAENAPALRLRPTTPNDRGAWATKGGGAIQHSIKPVTLAKTRPDLIGHYTATLHPDGLYLIPISAGSTSTPIDTVALTWRQIIPTAYNQRRGQASQILAPARITKNGFLILAGGGPKGPVEQLGAPDHILIFADTDAKQLRIEPGLAADPAAWRLSGAGVLQRRVGLTAFTKANPDMIGLYTVGATARGILLRKK